MAINVYKLIKMATGKGLPMPMRLLGLWGMHVVGKRTIGIFIDPVLACNLRCKMCYFSDAEKRASMKGKMDSSQLDLVEKALFHRGLKLQIGCGAEPTLYSDLEDIVKRGKRSGIPYISLTTNGQLIASGRVDLMRLVEAGLNEITLSLHGTDKETYEYLMPGADYDKLLKLVNIIREVKREHPQFVVRVNYTVNSLNVDNLAGDKFWRLWGEGKVVDVVQLRPVQDLGVSEWRDFDHTSLKEKYDDTIGAIVKECKARGITCLAPDLSQIDAVNEVQDAGSAIIEDFSYCYVSPSSCYKDDFNLQTDTYESYHKRHQSAGALFASAFRSNKSRERHISKKLNYTVN